MQKRANGWSSSTTAQKPNEETRQIAYAGAAIPARFALERGDWAAASQLTLHPAREQFNWSPFPEGEAVNAYARGLGAARRGDAAAAKAEIARLTALRAAMVDAEEGLLGRAGGHPDRRDLRMDRACGRPERRRAEDSCARPPTVEDKTEEHIMMPGRVIPVREMLGELLLELKQPAPALAAFEQSQKNDPNRFRNVYGAARAAELAGDRKKASAFYAKLLAQVGTTQVGTAVGRSEIEHARSFTTNH